ncbi:MAG: OmpA family protein [Deltaproteobacteria bacterium]|nr:OmpA family protein [Deltaproteobacteria bacterium]
MPKKKKKESSMDTNAWMTTYTDLMTLLLTFFVLLLSMSVVTEEKRLVALNSLTGAFGFKPGGHSIIGAPKGINITIGSPPMKKEVIDFDKMRNLILKNALDPDVIVTREGERIILSLNNQLLFDQGSSEIRPDLHPFLVELGEILKEGTHRIELRGYSATSETAFDRDPFKASVMLSAKRAIAVYHFFREKSGISPGRMVAHGFGTNAVRKGNPKKENEAGRQVEIILDYRESVPYRLRKPKSDSLLDFKGFLFRIPGR